MIEINSKKIDMWSKIGSRATLGLAILEMEKNLEKLIVVTCDVSTSAGLDRFRKQKPDKYLDLGISEQNMIGVSSGIASEGFKVITTTFAPFQTLRCCEQIKVNLGYMKTKIVMVGLASGLVLGTLGYTHCSIEEVGALRSIPNITIISPADTLEVVKALVASINHKESVYIRLTGGAPMHPLYKKDYNFEIGKAVKLKDGNDIAIFSTGASVYHCMEAAKILEEKGVSCSVVNVHTIKPIDKKMIMNETKRKKLIISVEEHNIIGGLGSAVSETVSQLSGAPRIISIGINDSYGGGGTYKFLLNKYGLNAEGIVKRISTEIKLIK